MIRNRGVMHPCDVHFGCLPMELFHESLLEHPLFGEAVYLFELLLPHILDGGEVLRFVDLEADLLFEGGFPRKRPVRGLGE